MGNKMARVSSFPLVATLSVHGLNSPIKRDICHGWIDKNLNSNML